MKYFLNGIFLGCVTVSFIVAIIYTTLCNIALACSVEMAFEFTPSVIASVLGVSGAYWGFRKFFLIEELSDLKVVRKELMEFFTNFEASVEAYEVPKEYRNDTQLRLARLSNLEGLNTILKRIIVIYKTPKKVRKSTLELFKYCSEISRLTFLMDSQLTSNYQELRDCRAAIFEKYDKEKSFILGFFSRHKY